MRYRSGSMRISALDNVPGEPASPGATILVSELCWQQSVRRGSEARRERQLVAEIHTPISPGEYGLNTQGPGPAGPSQTS
jgi:hypothetical protein